MHTNHLSHHLLTIMLLIQHHVTALKDPRRRGGRRRLRCHMLLRLLGGHRCEPLLLLGSSRSGGSSLSGLGLLDCS